MKEIQISADDLVGKLLTLSETERVCFLDSSGVDHLDSHLLIAGLCPLETLDIRYTDAKRTLKTIDDKFADPNIASIFTLSYDFGLKLAGIQSGHQQTEQDREPDLFIALFDVLVVHDYRSGNTRLVGNHEKFPYYEELLSSVVSYSLPVIGAKTDALSNFTKSEYIANVERIKQYIRDGETYQTNLTQQFNAKLAKTLTPQVVFHRLRKEHPAPFSAFLSRNDDHVVSLSPERFVSIADGRISASPIKGTRPRGKNAEEDQRLRLELIGSKKDRAENIMIVDLLRNDIGRICEFGSVEVEKLCDLEEHPSLFHLVSTISGKVRNNTSPSEIILAIFPCGSITGCPKIRTMELIDEIETVNRGLSMGAIGYSGFDKSFDLNVAIRTMVIRDNQATFNVGGGIISDSDPKDEYQESLLKAQAIFKAINARLD